jgi:hypothetical protein
MRHSAESELRDMPHSAESHLLAMLRYSTEFFFGKAQSRKNSFCLKAVKVTVYQKISHGYLACLTTVTENFEFVII